MQCILKPEEIISIYNICVKQNILYLSSSSCSEGNEFFPTIEMRAMEFNNILLNKSISFRAHESP